MSNPHMLEDLYIRLGEPRWYWPSVLTVIFVVLPLVGSAWE